MTQVYKVEAELNEAEIIYPDSDGEPMAETESELANQRAETELVRAERLEALLRQLNPDLLKPDDLA